VRVAVSGVGDCASERRLAAAAAVVRRKRRRSIREGVNFMDGRVGAWRRCRQVMVLGEVGADIRSCQRLSGEVVAVAGCQRLV
jgi:hypothetical protein